MNDSLKFFKENKILDTIFSVEEEVSDIQYKNFKFVSEAQGKHHGPQEREITYISPGWSFSILLFSIILIVLNRSISNMRISSFISTPFLTNNDKSIRDNNTIFSISSLLTIISFIMILSLFIQKTFTIFGGNNILHNNINFYTDILFAVAAFFSINYLMIAFFSWLFKSESLIYMHVSLHLNAMAICNLVLIPVMMILLFYPYNFICTIAFVISLLIFLIRIVKLLIEVQILPKVGFLNIFLYLCSVEILPLSVITKIVFDMI